MLLLLLMSVVLVFLFVYQNEKAIVDKVSESNINGHMLKKNAISCIPGSRHTVEEGKQAFLLCVTFTYRVCCRNIGEVNTA